MPAANPPPGHTTAPDESSDTIMADNNANFAASPYPVYNLGGNGDDDSLQQAVLTSHVGASVERNQDAQFVANRDFILSRDVVGGAKDAEIRALEVKADLLAEIKDHERRSVERDNAVQRELALIRAEHAAQGTAVMSRELARVEADARQAKTDAVLAAILAKLTPPTP